MNRKLLLALFFVLVSMPFSDVSTDLIVFKTGQDTTGNNLDGIKNDTGLPTTVNVAEIAGLTLTVVDISSDSAVVDQLNATATSFGVDAINVGVGGSDDSDQFDSSLNESVVFRFNQDVVINSVDFLVLTTVILAPTFFLSHLRQLMDSVINWVLVTFLRSLADWRLRLIPTSQFEQ